MRAFLLALLLCGPAVAQTERVDLALVLAVDVSESVDSARYTLQMQGIARALEDRSVQSGLLSGPNGAALVALVQWSNRPALTIPWTLLTSEADLRRFTAEVRQSRRASKGFTCMSVALRSIADRLVTQLPVPADRTVVDVSGDGRDNCNPREGVGEVRDELVAAGITVNGLPILEGAEAGTLEAWYRENVIGGPSSFLVPAQGFADFERAIRRKFVVEISRAN